MNNEVEKKNLRDEIDWVATLVPLFGVVVLGILFMIFPDASSAVLEGVRSFLGDQFSIYYALIAVGVFVCRGGVCMWLFQNTAKSFLVAKIVKSNIPTLNGV